MESDFDFDFKHCDITDPETLNPVAAAFYGSRDLPITRLTETGEMVNGEWTHHASGAVLLWSEMPNANIGIIGGVRYLPNSNLIAMVSVVRVSAEIAETHPLDGREATLLGVAVDENTGDQYRYWYTFPPRNGGNIADGVYAYKVREAAPLPPSVIDGGRLVWVTEPYIDNVWYRRNQYLID